MAVIKDLKDRVDELEQRGCACSGGSSWVSELGFPALLIAVSLSAYGCSMASNISTKTDAYKSCVAAKDLTDACRMILGQGR